jgi:DNA (cytosine-5)-methyltransferase 1
VKMLSLFSGIGGIDLAARWAGIETVAFCEIEPFCQKVLSKHWPEVPIFDDVRELTAVTLRERGVSGVDIIAGGFPCQDISQAGHKAGIDGERSGLWSEIRRLTDDLRPRYVVVENVSALLIRGMGRVLGDLAASGYDAEWDCLPASAFGAPHRRDRLFLVAYPASGNDTRRKIFTRDKFQAFFRGQAGASLTGCVICTDVAHPDGDGLEENTRQQLLRTQADQLRVRGHHCPSCGAGVSMWDGTAPPLTNFCGMADGIPRRVDRLRGLGNAVVPQVVYPIFEAIKRHDTA